MGIVLCIGDKALVGLVQVLLIAHAYACIQISKYVSGFAITWHIVSRAQLYLWGFIISGHKIMK